MPLYNEENVTSTEDKTRYEYSYKVEVNNPLNGESELCFKTATVELDNNTGTEVLLDYKRTLKEPYASNETFNLLNPADGSTVGTMDYDTLYLALYSLFFHVANKVDNP